MTFSMTMQVLNPARGGNVYHAVFIVIVFTICNAFHTIRGLGIWLLRYRLVTLWRLVVGEGVVKWPRRSLNNFAARYIMIMPRVPFHQVRAEPRACCGRVATT